MITADFVRSILNYNQETGAFTWIVQRSNVSSGSVAGHVSKSGYTTISICDKTYLAHRLAWMHVNGCFPDCDIDHIDGNRSNNRFSNLRLDPLRQNQQNRKTTQRNNKSGFPGVYWHKSVHKWHARIHVKRKSISAGFFDDPRDAYEAYLSAKRQFHPFYAI